MSQSLEEVERRDLNSVRQRLKSPRAAAVAGILFAVLFTTGIVLIRTAVPDDITAANASTWAAASGTTISLALNLVPFAGIAFLWFMGVIRDRLGELEDQFFSTVFLGSGLLFVGMMFVASAIATGLIASYSIVSDQMIESGIITFGRQITYAVINIYGIRMAGVFMISLATIWLRTQVMPRPFIFLTYPLALIMLLTVNLTLWLILIFPAWVFIISVYILIFTLRRDRREAKEAAAVKA